MRYFFITLLMVSVFLASCGNDEESSGTAKISIETSSIEEGDDDKTINLNVQTSATSVEDIVVIINTKDGTAIAGEDYEALNNFPVIIPANSSSTILSVTIIGDRVLETDENFFIEIISVSEGEIEQTETEIVLLNDDNEFDEFIPDSGYETPTSYAGMELIFSEEFEDGTELTDNWTFELGNGDWGWGNQELQDYTEENASLINGNLVIEATRVENSSQITSTRMKTKGNFDFTYGRVDIRAALPKGQGLWPALWMLGTDFDSVGWPACGEIDIMEMLGHQPDKVYGTIHWQENGQQASYEGSTFTSAEDFGEQFHVFSLEWTETSITWLLDDQAYHTIGITNSKFDAFHKDFFLIFNVAVGGDWPGNPNASTVYPQRMVVDYVRVFQ